MAPRTGVPSMSNNWKGALRRVRESALLKNPILLEAGGIAPVVAMSVSLKSAIMVAFVSAAELCVIELFASLCLKKVKNYYRVAIYAVLGMLLNLPLYLMFNYLAPNETVGMGIYLPLMAMNSLIVLHCERFAVKNTPKHTFIDAVSAAASYGAVVLLVGVVREIIGSGTVYSVAIPHAVTLPGWLLPFGGFALLGVFAAVLKRLTGKRYPNANLSAGYDTSEVEDTYYVDIYAINSVEFNPYDDAQEEEQASKRTALRKKRGEKKTDAPKKKSSEPKKKSGEPKRKKASAAKSSDTAEKSTPRPRRHTGEDYISEFSEVLKELSEYEKLHEKEEDNTGGDEA